MANEQGLHKYFQPVSKQRSIEVYSVDEDRFKKVCLDDSMLYPVQESDRERVKELEAMAKKLASEEDFENAESVQQEANSLHKNIKNSMNSIEEVSSCYKDAKACYNMYTQRKQYRMAGEWNNVVNHLEKRLAPYAHEH